MNRSGWLARWKDFLRQKRGRTEFTVTLVLLIAVVYSLSRYLIFNETRDGAVLDDPILEQFTAIELNIPIFFAIYSSLLIGIVAFSFNPKQLITSFQTYTVLVILRMISMYLIPLDPPKDSIDLQDPIVFIAGTGMMITKDLFFSGHTSTSFMLFQVARNKYLRMYFLAATITVGTSVILQKAHYAIDVVAGLVYSYAAYQIVRQFQHWLEAERADQTQSVKNIKSHEV